MAEACRSKVRTGKRDLIDPPAGTRFVAAMKLTINGEIKNLEVQTLAELLEQLGLHGMRCATMVNGRIVKRFDRPTARLAPDDQVDIISMVGGG